MNNVSYISWLGKLLLFLYYISTLDIHVCCLDYNDMRQAESYFDKNVCSPNVSVKKRLCLETGDILQGAFGGARGSFQGQKVEGGQQVNFTNEGGGSIEFWGEEG